LTAGVISSDLASRRVIITFAASSFNGAPSRPIIVKVPSGFIIPRLFGKLEFNVTLWASVRVPNFFVILRASSKALKVVFVSQRKFLNFSSSS
jgi:hypothetical protein